MNLKPGDTVVYSDRVAMTELMIKGEDYALIKEKDIIGKLPGRTFDASDVPNLIPLGERILIKQGDAQDETEGGLILTEAGREKPSQGVVVRLGPGKEDPKNPGAFLKL